MVSYRNFKDELPAHTYLHLFVFEDKISKAMLLARYEGISEIHSLNSKYDAYKFILDNDSCYYVKCSDIIDGNVQIQWIPFNEIDKLINDSSSSQSDRIINGVINSISRESCGVITCDITYTDTIKVKCNTSNLVENDEQLLISSLCHKDEIELSLTQSNDSLVPTIKYING